MQENQILIDSVSHDRILNIRMEEIGWALFLILIGGLWLLPEGSLPSYTWLLGAGVIMLGVNLARYFAGIKMSGFTILLGVVALLAGASGVLAIQVPIFPALLIVIGIALFLRALLGRSA